MTKKHKETVSYLKSQQHIFPDWMEEAVKGLTDDALVIVERIHAPFGTFVMSIEKV
tara:strand:+ start:431 stop:598 length:168 start_codon:yes stop_codon:yes gene_type:complete